MTEAESYPEWVIDPDTPSVARMYDYYLGGKDHFASDRAAAGQVVAALPNLPEATRANRRFLSKAVTLLAERGVRQFLDIGSGLPTQENVHQVAQRNAPDAQVIYVDNDPIVLTHARALLADNARTTVIEADLRDPDGIIGHPVVRERFDLTRPVGLLMLAILNFIPDDAAPAEIVARLREPLAPGSHLVISHGHAGEVSQDVRDQVHGAYGMTVAGDIFPRPPHEVMPFFDGCELLPPGLTTVEDWEAGADFHESDLNLAGFLGGVGRVL